MTNPPVLVARLAELEAKLALYQNLGDRLIQAADLAEEIQHELHVVPRISDVWRIADKANKLRRQLDRIVHDCT